MTQEHKYIAVWEANNNSTVGSFTGNNKAEMRKDAREILKGNLFAGNNGSWTIYDMSTQEELASGIVKK